MRTVLHTTMMATLGFLLACGAERDPLDTEGRASASDGASTSTTPDGDTTVPWDNGGRCPDGPEDDVTLPTTCPPLEGSTWCWTTTDDGLVAFAVRDDEDATCITALDRPLEVRDMTEHAGFLYACVEEQLVQIDPDSGAVNDMGRVCRGLASFDGGLLLNEGTDVRWYADEEGLLAAGTGLRYGGVEGDFIETWRGTLYGFLDGQGAVERTCTNTGETRSDLVLTGLEGPILGLSVLDPARLFVLDDSGSVRQFDASTGMATGLTRLAPEGSRGLLCGAL